MIDISPSFHGPLCMHLDEVRLPYGRRLDLWPRGHLKTHVITIGKNIQYYLNDQNVRILLAGSNIDNSRKNLSKIKSLFESCEVLRWLFPEFLPNTSDDKWAANEIVLPRRGNPPEPTFKCIGVGGRIVGWHFDVVCKDDLIDDKTERSPEVMERIIDWHVLSKSLLESPSSGVDQVVGTRWTVADLYQYILDNEPEYESITVAAIDSSGNVVWPERFDKDALLALRERDPYIFACQQMNNPRDEAVVDFNANWLRYYQFAEQNLDLLAEIA